MSVMGPEAAVLNAPLKSRRAWRAYANLEYSRESPLYVAVALRPRTERFPVPLEFERPLGPWAKLRWAFRLGAERRGGRSPYALGVGKAQRATAPSVCAVPAARLLTEEGRRGVREKPSTMAALPLNPEALG